MQTLSDVKTDLRLEIRYLKEALKDLKNEQCGIDRLNGNYYQSSKYEMKLQIESQLENVKRFYNQIKGIKKLK
jgi:hypothetical protein